MEDSFTVKTKELCLTRHRAGTLRELWAIAWPLMLASFSGTLMTFIDRVVLARYQSAAFDACAAAQPWYWTFESTLMAFVVCAEIIIGRFNGAKQYKKIGPAVWQMVTISFATSLMLYPLAHNAHYLLADNIEKLGLPYLQLLFLTLPFEMAAFGAIGAFFVGRGDTKKIPIVLLTESIINFVLDIWLVFGGLGVPALGIVGAALATNIAHICSFLIFLGLFLRKKYREKYAINTYYWSWDFLRQCFHIGMPNVVCCGVWMSGWALTYQFFSLKVPPYLYKAYCIAFTVYNFMFFVMDGLGKSVGTLCANFIGSHQRNMLGKVLKQSIWLTAIFSFVFFTLLLFSSSIVRLLAPESLWDNEVFNYQVKLYLVWYWVLFILHTLCFCAEFFLFALMKTKIVLVLKVTFSWGMELIPMYFLVMYMHCNPVVYLELSCLSNVLLLLMFFWWYRKKTWLKPYKIEQGS